MATEIESKAFLRSLRLIVRKYRLQEFKALSEALDSIRVSAADYIVPNTVGRKMSPYRMSKLQPSTPGVLTDRTGRLIKMLTSKGKWNLSSPVKQSRAGFEYTQNKKMTLTNPYFKGIVRTVGNVGTERELLRADLSIHISSPNPLLGNEYGSRIQKIITESGVKMERYVKPITTSDLYFRLKWETGVRGSKRPFIRPAAEKKEIYTRDIVAAKIREVGTIQ